MSDPRVISGAFVKPTSSTDLLILSSIGTEVSFRLPCPGWPDGGFFFSMYGLLTQLVPGEMIVRKDGRDDLLAVGGGVRHRRPCVHCDGYGR